MSRHSSATSLVRSVASRLRARRALTAGAWSVTTCALVHVALRVVMTDWLASRQLTIACLLATAPLAWAGAAALWPVSAPRIARLIDRRFGWPDTMQTACEVRARKGATETAFEQALLRRADRDAIGKRGADVLPMRVSPALLAVCAIAAGFATLTTEKDDAPPAAIASRSPAGKSARNQDVRGALAEIERERASGRLSRPEAIKALLALEEQLSGPQQAPASRPGEKLRRLESTDPFTRPPSSSPQHGQRDAAEKRQQLDALRRERQGRESAEPRGSEPSPERGSGSVGSPPTRAPSEKPTQQQEQTQLQERAASLREQLQREQLDAQGERSPGESASPTATSESQLARLPAPQAPSGGSEPGSSEPDLFHRQRRTKAQHEDHAVASQLNEGPSRSEVIITAAKHGFAAAPYQRVYREYRDHAETWIATDQVPTARRYYVRRYFDAIGPQRNESAK